MDHVTISLVEMLGHFRACFARAESFAVFQPVVVAWILCLRGRTLTEVWQLTGLASASSSDLFLSFGRLGFFGFLNQGR